jgi:transcriptional regulator with PAS, ATPase and Fis domain
MGNDATFDQTWSSAGDGDAKPGPPRPGLVALFSGRRPMLEAFALEKRPLVLGRDPGADVTVADRCMSRHHVEVSFADDQFVVRDLDSHNGTFVDGTPARGPLAPQARFLRAGDTVFLLSRDIRRFMDATVELRGEVVIGPTLAERWREIAHAAQTGADTLHLHGETGSGKELAARLFHDRGQSSRGPFVAVNCASLPPQLAERLLFGARRGAYSGADADVEGLIQAAHGGTLFLDEVAELPPELQAKLLRVLQSKEVLPLGGTRPVRVEVRVCSAALSDLRADVASGRFREDLYFRIGRPAVELPALRERPEDIAWLASEALRRVHPDLMLHATLVEAAVLRAWPGNVRELVREIAEAGRKAWAQRQKIVKASHLFAEAGMALRTGAVPERGALDAGQVEQALRREHGNVTAAARTLGLHRNQLRRWLATHAVDPEKFRV